MSEAINTVMNKEQIVELCANIKTRGIALDNDIQSAAMGIIIHVNEHHEVSLMNMLMDSLGQGHRHQALADWFMANGKCDYDEEAKQFIPLRMDDFELNLLTAAAKPWFQFKAPPVKKAFNFKKHMEATFKKAKKARNDKSELAHQMSDEEYMGLMRYCQTLGIDVDA